ncbi:MAG: T9SS type A sorting domain-containing protein, partial [candidate division KSB1 bacterium]|nr:T9SS type A sorting domain-containing protein [candidate division KSB1 bacterium]
VAGWEKRTYKGLIDGFKLYNYPAAGLTTGIREKGGVELPKEFALEQNYPNPFNPVTEIIFSVPKTEKVSLVIYDMLGRKVKTLIDKQVQPGVYSVYWDGTDESGVKVATGVYLYRLQARNYSQVRKMVLIK